jgi:hypothetical protein
MRTALILAGMMFSLAAEPQEIYRWVDKDGVVHYADQPGAPDAQRVEIANANEYEAVPQESGGGATYNEPAAPPPYDYDSVTIAQPTPDQVFFGADASVMVSAEIGGTLQPDHTLVFFLDGNRVSAALKPGTRHAFSARKRARPEWRTADIEPADHVPRAPAVDQHTPEPAGSLAARAAPQTSQLIRRCPPLRVESRHGA